MKRKAKRTTNFFHLVPVGKMIFQPPQKKKNKFHAKHLVQNSRFHFRVIQEVSFIKKGSLRWNHTFKKKLPGFVGKNYSTNSPWQRISQNSPIISPWPKGMACWAWLP